MGYLTPQVTYEEYPADMVASVKKAINIYCVDKHIMPVKITTVICLLVAPVGLQAFAESNLPHQGNQDDM